MKQPELKYYQLGDNVTAFSSTRHGGVSNGNYGEFNINAFCGDTEQNISQNRDALCVELGIEDDRLVMPHQTHGIESRDIAEEFFTLPEEVRKMLLENVDCVMTDVKNTCIGVSTADCIPVLLYDPLHHTACAVHAGWRGTLNRITHKEVLEMNRVYGTSPSDVKAVVGPGISLENFEVGQEVYDEFEKVGFEMNKIARMYDKWHIDLSLCNKLQLEQAGVKAENIQMSDICTFSQVNDYFSARRLGTDSGRIYTGIILR